MSTNETCDFCDESCTAYCDYANEGGRCDAKLCDSHRTSMKRQWSCSNEDGCSHTVDDFCPHHARRMS